MEKKYNHQLVEKEINNKWIEKGFFSNHSLSKKPFFIFLPPPNITGKLHLGHALDSYIQDVLIRYKKLKNYDVFFLPSMDHAGIATQAKIQKFLKNENLNENPLTKTNFISEAKKWQESYFEKIKKQWNMLGLGLDYSNFRYTLDKDSSAAVNKAFIALWNKKLIYYGKKTVNWDVQLQTTISNIEVITKEVKNTMFYVKYKIDFTEKYLIVATTRPETIFSDVAVGLNPKHRLAEQLKNKFVLNPLTQKKLPIILDKRIEITKGSGAMKISGHSMMDFEIIQDHNLEPSECINEKGILYNSMQFDGLERFSARKKIASFLEEQNLISKKENVKSLVEISDRSGSIIEILIKPQWFIKMRSLSDEALAAMKTSSNSLKFVPAKFKNHLTRWLINIKDWTISRQLWWGHPIPAWHKAGKIKVQLSSPGPEWKKDKNVLDTWFSSSLIPFSFLGWPLSQEKLRRYFPSNVLVTGYDIIFFWVARMYFQSLFFMKSKPFKVVLIHGLIRDEKGRKMSKSLNNGIDPIEIIKQFGSDSLRWGLITSSTLGQDIKFSISKIKDGWNLNNKIWNITRSIYLLDDSKSLSRKKNKNINHWINNELKKFEIKIRKYLNKYNFTLIKKTILKFLETTLSSQYIEISKVNFNLKNSLMVLKKTLIILHPFLPFTTDYLFKLIFNEEILNQKWPTFSKYNTFSKITRLFKIIKILRKFREERKISKKLQINYFVENIDEESKAIILKLTNFKFNKNKSIPIIEGSIKIFISLPEEIHTKERQILLKRIEFITFEMNRAKKILSNSNFLKKAPPSLIQAEKDKLHKYVQEFKKVNKLLESYKK